MTISPNSTGDDHYIIEVTNMPPTEIICKCGARFVGGDVIAKQKQHQTEAASNQEEAGKS